MGKGTRAAIEGYGSHLLLLSLLFAQGAPNLPHPKLTPFEQSRNAYADDWSNPMALVRHQILSCNINGIDALSAEGPPSSVINNFGQGDVLCA